MDNERLITELYRIHDKWQDKRIIANHKDSPHTHAILSIIEELVHDLVIAVENATDEEDDS